MLPDAGQPKSGKRSREKSGSVVTSRGRIRMTLVTSTPPGGIDLRKNRESGDTLARE